MTISVLPWYARTTYILLGFVLLLLILYVGRDLLIPLAFAALLAVMLHPVSRWLQRRGVPRTISIFLTVTFACLVLAGLAILIAMQVGQFGEELPRIKDQGLERVRSVQTLIEENLGITYRDQLRWFQQWWTQNWQRGGAAFGQALLTFMDVTSLVLLVPLYAFLMLFYDELIGDFLFELFGREDRATLKDVLVESRTVVKSYLVGLMIETGIIAILNTTALLILDIDYAILFGVLAALLNLIPYIGILLGSLLPIFMAVLTKDSAWYPVGVAASFAVIQIIDNNLLVPYIVASRVSINALISVIAVIFGGMLWGISGMFLSLPTVAILKVIFDRIESTKPWGRVLGTTTSAKPAAAERRRG